MAPHRSRYAVDPSLVGHGQQTAQQGQQPPVPNQYQEPSQTFSPGFGASAPAQQSYQQPAQQAYQQPHPSQSQYGNPPGPQFHTAADSHAAPTGPYTPAAAPRVNTYSAEASLRPQPAPQPFNYPPENHIAPPPHSAGPRITGPRARIDPSQMPDPIEAQELDQNLYDEEDFLSCETKGLIPLAITDYRGIDQGNSLPRYLRSTLQSIPATSQLLDTTGLPFGLVVQPFAQLRYDEAPVPLVSNWVAGESAFDAPHVPSGGEDVGPPRCDKCRAYINPWVRFIDSGRRWTCNLCGSETAVPPAYFSHLSPTGQRIDQNERPELLHGTVDFAVPREYWFPQPSGSILDANDDSAANLVAASDALATTGADLLGALQQSLGGGTPLRGNTPTPGHRGRHTPAKEERLLRRPVPLGRVFVIDVSASSTHRGIPRAVCESIRIALYGSKPAGEEADSEEDEDVIGEGERVGFVTVGSTVGFWNCSAALDSAQLLVVSDLDDMFCPLAGGFLVDPRSSRSQIEGLLNMLPGMYEAHPEGGGCAVGAAVKGCLDGLRSSGGQLNIFLSALPMIGPGKLRPREEQSMAGTDKEKGLYQPNDPFWRVTGDELAEAGIGVNTFVFPDQAIDLASVGALSAVTGGEGFFHPRFDPVRDREILVEEVKRVVTRETAYNATVRVRCSNGLRVADHTGNFYQRSVTDLEFGTLDDAKAFTAHIKYDGHRLNDREMAYVQAATLYTSASGQRRVRVNNLALSISTIIGNIFRYADFDAAITVLYKDVVTQLPYKNLKDIRRGLIERCNKALLMYRKHCAPAVQSGQLILPEGFKLLPMYTLCMIKSKAIKGGNVIADVRSHYQRWAKGSSAVGIMSMLYPRLLAIHDLDASYGFPGPNGRLKMPRFMRASYMYMVADGAYLLCNGETAMIWFGNSVFPPILNDLYGVESLEELDTRITKLPKLPTLLSTQVRNLLTHFERIIGHGLPVYIVRQDRDGIEIEFANQLVEDSNNDALSYTDYLMSAHKSITNELSGRSDGWRAPWS